MVFDCLANELSHVEVLNGALRNRVRTAITDRNVNLNIFVTYSGQASDFVGVAWLASICSAQYKFRSTIVEYFRSDLITAQVRSS